MKTFNVLDPRQDLSRSRLLEASAGTGKTFAIEHCIVRLLFEGDVPCRFDEILAVTFTRAATADLKKRIRDQLKNASLHIREYFTKGVFAKNAAPYLAAYSDETLKIGLRSIEDALYDFDAAAIYTIHQFCSKSLKEFSHLAVSGLKPIPDDENNSQKNLNRKVHDFFLNEEVTAFFSEFQWKLALKGKRSSSFESLMQDVVMWAQKGVRLKELPSLKVALEELQIEVDGFKKIYGSDIETFRKKYDEARARFNGFNSIDPAIFEEFLQAYSKTFLDLADFDKVLRFCVVVAPLFNEENKSKKKTSAFDFSFASALFECFSKYSFNFGSGTAIKAHLAENLRQKLFRDKLKEGIFDYGDFLSLMQKSLMNDSFCQALRQKYKVAIVDEFQDTDPLQWEIFQKIFLTPSHRLFLVGDPKQAIYRFRQADIYTYLDAAKQLGQEQHATLDTNYRSNKDLIEALNVLMSENTTPGWISLPKADLKLPFRPVHAGKEERYLHSRKALCFYAGEKKEQELFLANEVLNLKRNEGVSFSSVAILVSDRKQEKPIREVFDTLNIPYQKIDRSDIRKSPVWSSLLDAMEAALHPNDPKAIKRALSGQLFGWTSEKLQELIQKGAESLQWQEIAAFFFRLKKRWEQKGFASFYEHLIQTQDRLTELLKRPFGKLRALELQKIAEKLMAFEFENKSTPTELVHWMKKMESFKDELPEFLVDTGSEEESVKILTIHKSKGLEFDFVFAHGLSSSIKDKNELLYVEDEKGPCLIPNIEGSADEYNAANSQEELSESLRRFYVAMTRAKSGLYVPFSFDDKKPTILQHFFSHLTLSDLSENAVLGHLKELGRNASIEVIELSSELPLKPWEGATKKNELFLKIKPALIEKTSRIHSFSSLKNDKTALELFDKQVLGAPKDPLTEIKTLHTLPAGSATGILLHTVFEKIDFTSKEEKIRACIAKICDYSHLSNWQDVIFEGVQSVLNLPLKTDFDVIYLKDLRQENCYREMEFQLTADDFDGPVHKKDFLKGVIDLLFFFNGRYYLLDWKSNWLGPKNSDYAEDKLKGAMEENDYNLQAAIYKKALEKYLKVMHPGKEFNELFGGVFYVFLRGAKMIENVLHGVLWQK